MVHLVVPYMLIGGGAYSLFRLVACLFLHKLINPPSWMIGGFFTVGVALSVHGGSPVGEVIRDAQLAFFAGLTRALLIEIIRYNIGLLIDKKRKL